MRDVNELSEEELYTELEKSYEQMQNFEGGNVGSTFREVRREAIIKQWFGAWFNSEWDMFTQTFSDDVYYSECWGPEYKGITQIQSWFTKWHKKSFLLNWDIQSISHDGDRTFVEWYFKFQNDGDTSEFNGMSLVEWEGLKICVVKEFNSELPKFNPYNSSKDIE